MSGFSMSTSMRMSQQQKLSPQMIQSINILALPVDELRERIEEEVDKNPALEIIKDATYVSGMDGDSHQAFLENAPNPGQTLQEHLLSQLAEVKLSIEKRYLAELVIQNLDDKGYFIEPPETLLSPILLQNSSSLDERMSNEDLSELIFLIQGFEPIGICCSGLQESLLIQAKHRSDVPELALIILEKYFELLETPRPALVLRKLIDSGVTLSSEQYENSFAPTLEQVEDAINFIKTLDPFPAREFATSKTVSYVVPDVVVRSSTEDEKIDGKGPFVVEMVKGTIPEIALSEDFQSMGMVSKEAKKFVSESVKNADWFINAVKQRKITVYKVASAIVKHQSTFFEKGPRFLAPLKMKDIADEINVHEATVSRIVNGKFLRCSFGFFELRYFFTNAISSNSDSNKSENTSHSKQSVKQEILKIVTDHEASGSKKNLSDQKIVDKLAEKGITVARRTVAKYRSELNILSSFDR